MKKKQFLKTTLLALALTLGGTTTAWADEVSVTTAAEFGAAYKTAMDATDGGSTTIILSEGTYAVTTDHITYGQLEIPASRTVTVKAANNADVTLKVKVQANKTGATGSLIFDGIKLLSTAGANYGFVDFRSNTSTLGDVIFKNCEITATTDNPLNRCLITGGSNTGTINSIQFDNCTIHDLGTSYNFIYTTKIVKAVSVTNSTLYNYGGESLFYARTASTDLAFSFTFTNNTVYRWAKVNDRRAFASVGSNYSSSSIYTFKDNIIDGFKNDGTNDYVENSTISKDNFVLVQSNNGGTINILNNILLGFKNGGDGYNKNNVVWATGGPVITNTNYWPWDATFSDAFGFTVIPFTDAANGDFTLDVTNYPKLATASTVGSPLGAPSTWKYTWNSGTAKAGTLILPYEANIPEGVSAYTLTYSSGDAVSATKITTGVLPANTPVLLNAETASTNYYFTSTGTVPDAAPTELQKGAMTGVYANGYVPANSYVLQKGASGLGFYKVASANTISIKPYRAYLTAGQNASARFIDINFDDSKTTAINEAKGQELIANGQYFDLQGRKVANGQKPTAKGLYIVNGKKVVIK